MYSSIRASSSMYVHMYPRVCVRTRMHTYACVLSRWHGVLAQGERWGSSILADQSQGQGSCSGPCSRCMEASDGSSLAGCSFPAGPQSADSHQPSSSSSSSPRAHSPQGPGPESACPLGSILGVVRPRPAHADTYTCSHTRPSCISSHDTHTPTH